MNVGFDTAPLLARAGQGQRAAIPGVYAAGRYLAKQTTEEPGSVHSDWAVGETRKSWALGTTRIAGTLEVQACSRATQTSQVIPRSPCTWIRAAFPSGCSLSTGSPASVLNCKQRMLSSICL